MPQKGKDYAILTVGNGDEGPKKYMHRTTWPPIYMKLTPTGREIFGSIPTYWPLEGTAARAAASTCSPPSRSPAFPRSRCGPATPGRHRFQNGKIDLEKLYGQTSVVQRFGPARGEFVGVEWEMGHPCAKIKNTIAAGQMTEKDKKLVKAGAKMAGDKISLDETDLVRPRHPPGRQGRARHHPRDQAGGAWAAAGGPGGGPGGPRRRSAEAPGGPGRRPRTARPAGGTAPGRPEQTDGPGGPPSGGLARRLARVARRTRRFRAEALPGGPGGQGGRAPAAGHGRGHLHPHPHPAHLRAGRVKATFKRKTHQPGRLHRRPGRV